MCRQELTKPNNCNDLQKRKGRSSACADAGRVPLLTRKRPSGLLGGFHADHARLPAGPGPRRALIRAQTPGQIELVVEPGTVPNREAENCEQANDGEPNCRRAIHDPSLSVQRTK